MSIQIESDLKEILTPIDTKLDKLGEDVTELKVGLAEVKGDILTNRGILVSLILVILGGAAKIFGMVGNP